MPFFPENVKYPVGNPPLPDSYNLPVTSAFSSGRITKRQPVPRFLRSGTGCLYNRFVFHEAQEAFSFILLITFNRVNSSLSFSSNAFVMLYTRFVYIGMVIF